MRGALGLAALVSLVVFGGGPLAAMEGGWERDRVRVTDPDLLERLGLAPDAVLHLRKGGRFDGPFAPLMEAYVESAGEDGLVPEAPDARPRGNLMVMGTEFVDRGTGSFVRGSGGRSVWCESASNPHLEKLLQLPHGAEIDWVDFWGSDSCGEELHVALVSACQEAFAPGPFVFDLPFVAATSGISGAFYLSASAGGIAVDNLRCLYTLVAQFDDGTTSCDCGAGLVLDKARVRFSYPAAGTVVPVAEP